MNYKSDQKQFVVKMGMQNTMVKAKCPDGASDNIRFETKQFQISTALQKVCYRTHKTILANNQRNIFTTYAKAPQTLTKEKNLYLVFTLVRQTKFRVSRQFYAEKTKPLRI